MSYRSQQYLLNQADWKLPAVDGGCVSFVELCAQGKGFPLSPVSVIDLLLDAPIELSTSEADDGPGTASVLQAQLPVLYMLHACQNWDLRSYLGLKIEKVLVLVHLQY